MKSRLLRPRIPITIALLISLTMLGSKPVFVQGSSDIVPELELLTAWFRGAEGSTNSGWGDWFRSWLPRSLRSAEPPIPQVWTLEDIARDYREKWLLPEGDDDRSFGRYTLLRRAVVQRAGTDVFRKGQEPEDLVAGIPQVVKEINDKELARFREQLKGASQRLNEILGTASEMAELADDADESFGSDGATPPPPLPPPPGDQPVDFKKALDLKVRIGTLEGAKRLRDIAAAITSGKGVTEEQAGQAVADVQSLVKALGDVKNPTLRFEKLPGLIADLPKRVNALKQGLRDAGKDWSTHLGTAVDLAEKAGMDPRAAKGIKTTVNTVLAFTSGNYVGAVMGMASLCGVNMGDAGGEMAALSDQLSEINNKIDKLQDSVDRLEAKLEKGLLDLQASLNRIEYRIDLLTVQRANEKMVACGSIGTTIDRPPRLDLAAMMSGLVDGNLGFSAQRCRDAMSDVIVATSDPRFAVYTAIEGLPAAREQVKAQLQSALRLERTLGQDPLLSIKPEHLGKEGALTQLYDVGFVLGAARSAQRAAWLELYGRKWDGLQASTPQALLTLYRTPDRNKMTAGISSVSGGLENTLILLNQSLWQMKVFGGVASVATIRDRLFASNTDDEALQTIRAAIQCNEKSFGKGCTSATADNVVRMRLRRRLVTALENDSYRAFAESQATTDARARTLQSTLCGEVPATKCSVVLNPDSKQYEFRLLTVGDSFIDALCFLDGAFWSDPKRFPLLTDFRLRPFNASMRGLSVLAPKR